MYGTFQSAQCHKTGICSRWGGFLEEEQEEESLLSMGGQSMKILALSISQSIEFNFLSSKSTFLSTAPKVATLAVNNNVRFRRRVRCVGSDKLRKSCYSIRKHWKRSMWTTKILLVCGFDREWVISQESPWWIARRVVLVAGEPNC